MWKAGRRPIISVQVLQELHANLSRKGGFREHSRAIVESYFVWEVVDNSKALLREALALQARWQTSFWDAHILAAALRANAGELWSEDFSVGQRFDSLLIKNPLAE